MRPFLGFTQKTENTDHRKTNKNGYKKCVVDNVYNASIGSIKIHLAVQKDLLIPSLMVCVAFFCYTAKVVLAIILLYRDTQVFP